MSMISDRCVVSIQREAYQAQLPGGLPREDPGWIQAGEAEMPVESST